MEKYIYQVAYFLNQFNIYSIKDNLILLVGLVILFMLTYFLYKLVKILIFVFSDIADDVIEFIYDINSYIFSNFKVISIMMLFTLFSYSIYLYISKNNLYFEVYEPNYVNFNKLIENVKKEYKQAKYEDLLLIYEEGLKRDIDVVFLYSLVATESAFKSNQISSSNAYGLFQIKLSTAKETAQKMFSNHEKVTRNMLLENHEKNIKLGIAYIELLKDRHLNYIEDKEKQQLILSYAYNGGIGRILNIFSNNSYNAQMEINNLSINTINEYLIYNLSMQNRDETINYPKKIYKHMQKFAENTNTENFELNIIYHIKHYLIFTFNEILYSYKSIWRVS